MNSLEAQIRTDITKGELNALRLNGNVPAIVYGGKEENVKISISKKLLKILIEKENFLSNIVTLNVNGTPQNVLPREITYDVLTDEPIHVDFLRVVPGVNFQSITPLNPPQSLSSFSGVVFHSRSRFQNRSNETPPFCPRDLWPPKPGRRKCRPVIPPRLQRCQL